MGRFTAGEKAVIGAAARLLFYPTLLYNVLRHKMQRNFNWWDQIDQFLLMGAVPFAKDVPRLYQLGVRGVITLNEPFETLVSSSRYQAYGIDHLVVPTMDYLYAPTLADISRAVNFIHRNASCGRTTYVHCKAGRGRSTTIVLCYLVKYKNMTPEAAFAYVRSIRPRVLLHSSQLRAVLEFDQRKIEDQPLEIYDHEPPLTSPQPDIGSTKMEDAKTQVTSSKVDPEVAGICSHKVLEHNKPVVRIFAPLRITTCCSSVAFH